MVIHRVKDFGILNKAEVDVFLELSCFLNNPMMIKCWQFDLWFLCLFLNQLEHQEVHGSCIAEARLGEFQALLH